MKIIKVIAISLGSLLGLCALLVIGFMATFYCCDDHYDRVAKKTLSKAIPDAVELEDQRMSLECHNSTSEVYVYSFNTIDTLFTKDWERCKTWNDEYDMIRLERHKGHSWFYINIVPALKEAKMEVYSYNRILENL